MSFFSPYSPNATGSVETLDEQTETESVVSFRRERPRHRESVEQHGEESVRLPSDVKMLMSSKHRWSQEFNPPNKSNKELGLKQHVLVCGVPGPRMNGQSRLERHLAGYESSSTMMSSELETTSFCDSDDDDTMSR